MYDLLLDQLFDVEYYRDLEIWIRGHSRSFILVPFDSLGTVSYSHSVVTMALSRIMYKELLVQKPWNFYTHPYLALRRGWPRRNSTNMFDIHKTRMFGLQCGEETMTICEAVSIEYRNVTDGQTVLLYQCHASGLTISSAVARCRACFVSLNTLISHSRSLGMTLVSRACVSPY